MNVHVHVRGNIVRLVRGYLIHTYMKTKYGSTLLLTKKKKDSKSYKKRFKSDVEKLKY